jgi:hypothetical protein
LKAQSECFGFYNGYLAHEIAEIISKEQKLWSMDNGLSTNPIYPQLPFQEFA